MNDLEAEKFSMRDPRTQTTSDRDFAAGMAAHFRQSLGTDLDKLRNFPKYVPRQALSIFLAKHEIFKHVLNVHGHIIECGVFLGGGLMTWAQLSAIYEPVNHVRRIVGFDTFTGFPHLSKQDKADNEKFAHVGGLATHAEDDLRETVRLYDMNRTIGHIPRVDLVVGDALETIPRYLADNSHLVVAMLYLDFDLYEPTKLALETFLPRMPKGAVICFDELGDAAWPGETLAALETVGLRNLRIRRFPTTSQLAYAVLD
jgi:hypothetical protein